MTVTPLTLQQVAQQQALAEGYANGPTPTVNPVNLSTQASLGNTLSPVTEPTPYFPPTTITPNLGLTLIGLDDTEAQNMVLIDSAVPNSGALLSVTITLTSAQLKSLGISAPITILPAAVGVYYSIDSAVFEFIGGTIAYAGGAPTWEVGLGTVTANFSNFPYYIISEITSIQTSVAGAKYLDDEPLATVGANPPLATSAVVNQPITIGNASGLSMTNGNGTLKVTVYYKAFTV